MLSANRKYNPHCKLQFPPSFLQNRYLATSRELTRLEGVTKAPVIDHFSETVLGATTIRCFKKEKYFFQGNLDKINSSLRMYFHNYAANEWLGFRLELIETLVLSITAFLMISLPSNFIKKGINRYILGPKLSIA